MHKYMQYRDVLSNDRCQDVSDTSNGNMMSRNMVNCLAGRYVRGHGNIVKP